MGGNVAENLSNQSVPEAAARVAAVVNRLVNRIGSNAESKERLAEIEIPEELRDNLALFLRLERRVLSEYDPEIADLFDKILTAEIVANAGNPGTRAADESVDEQGVPTADEPTAVAFREVVDLIDSLPLDKQQVIVRAFTSFFHLANLSEENYRVAQLREREAGASTDTEVDPANELTVAYHQLVNEMGVEGANELLDKLEFHPVFTAHPTEARRKAVEGKIRRISNLLEERPRLGGSDLVENERHMLQEIDALVRTSPIALKKPTPVEEADTIIDIFDNTLFDVIPVIYRRFDDWVLGDKAGTVPPLCPAFFHPGSWIGSDRDGNPNVTAKVSREVAAKYFTHMVLKLEDKCRRIGRNLTLEATYSKPSAELINLWNHQVEMSTQYTARAELISEHEPHRAVMLVMADRLNATVRRITDTMYHSADEFLDDLRVVQRSLAACGAVRAAYGPVQTIIWQVESFGFHMVEMEFRQHSVVHARALKDIHENGIHGDLQPMTREVIALFEQLEDLEGCVDVLDQMLTLPVVQKRLAQTNRRMEVMLGYSDSSKDAGPTTAMLALHSAQERIAKWAEKNDIDLVLMHGRGGAVGRGGGPANKAVLAQPKGSVNCFFKLTEQGEVIFARYGNRTLAQRHVESVAAATLLQSAPSVEKTNTETTQKFWDMAEKLNAASHERYLDLLNTEDFTPWFSTVTPLTEVGLLPIGSRPAKRGLGAKSLDDLRTIPWIFSWSQARINLAAWYGLGTACEQLGDLDQLKAAYQEWPFFRTFIDNIEMSIAKTDQRIAKMYLHLGDRQDLSEKVFTEMQLTRKWVLAIVGDEWPLQRRRVLGCAVRVRNPYVDALSIAQVRALREVRMNQDEMAEEKKAEYMSLILSTVTGVSAGLQNTG